jgi:hypothetical protein
MKAFLNHPIWGRDGSRGIYLIPIFGVCIVGILWLAVLNMLANEERSTVAAAMSSAEGIASTFEHRTVRAIRDADRTALLIKYLFERDGSVDVTRIIKNGLIPGDAYLLVSMTDARGQVIATSEPRAMAIQVSERDYFQRHAAQDTAHLDISKPTIPAGFREDRNSTNQTAERSQWAICRNSDVVRGSELLYQFVRRRNAWQ